MVVERLKREDLPKYKALIDEAFDGSQELDKYLSYDENSSAYQVIVLKEKEDIVATVTMYKLNLFTFSFQPTIELFNLAVKKEYRRHNLGKILIEYVIDYAKDNGYKTIHLTCLESEKEVHVFYENVGFKRAESRNYNLYL